MGKLLEAAAQEGADIYILQQLAEAASRSNGRLVIVGILHQAFEEYAHRLTREMRGEWAKIQGRFVDLAVNTAGEEQIDLLSRAIETDHRPKAPGALARAVARAVHRERPDQAQHLGLTLEHCWPLHPAVACLLGPISRRRFGQNQRSVFGFLNSAEPHGFQDFLRHSNGEGLYGPDRLWDYLRSNLEPSILASPDGHRWALAVQALERCESAGGTGVHLRLLKTIAVIDLFKERSGLVPSVALLEACLPDVSRSALKQALGQLDRWSLVLFRKFLDAYAIFAGSDFDIDEAVRHELAGVDALDFDLLKSLAGLQPILAKRHYHETGALRWFEIDLAPLHEVVARAADYQPENGSVGQFLLAIPLQREAEEEAVRVCRDAARRGGDGDVVVGLSKRSWSILALARELIALDNVRSNRAELQGDPVARQEVTARLATLQGQLESELQKACDSARWFRKHHSPKLYRHAELNGLASELADRRFHSCPRLHNELLNRQRPSGNAIAAQNALLRRMVLNSGEPRLGIRGFPAEGGLLASVLEAPQLYVESTNGSRFIPPHGEDPCRLAPAWAAAREYIRTNSHRTVAVADLYGLWREQPYGIKDGLMPVLAVAFILSARTSLAVYRDGIFRARFDDVDVEYLAKDPSTVQLRWMDLSDVARRLLSGMAEIVRTLDVDNSLVNLEPIDVARGLIGLFDRLPPWTKRTMRISANAARVRDLFKRARDPNQFLFDDIPGIAGAHAAAAGENELARIITGLREGLEELVQAYPTMLHRIRDIMLSELQVPNLSPQSLAELRDRATNVQHVGGDFRVGAFVGRLSQFDGTDLAFEGIAGLAGNKPPRDWVDPDLDRALVDLADMAQRFLRAETFARVKGRADKRHAVAVVIGMDGAPAPFLEEFQVSDADRKAVNALIARVAGALEDADTSRKNIVLAALAELSVQYMAGSCQPRPNPATGGRTRPARYA